MTTATKTTRINSRTKGKSGEREIAVLIKSAMQTVEAEFPGCRVYSDEVKRNTLQSDRGGYDLAGVPLLAIEVKREETLSLNTWWKQATDQARAGELPVLMYRQNNRPWRVRLTTGLTDRDGRVMSNAVADVDMPSFLAFWSALYRQFLTTAAAAA